MRERERERNSGGRRRDGRAATIVEGKDEENIGERREGGEDEDR